MSQRRAPWGAIIAITVLVMAAVAAPLLALQDPNSVDIYQRLLPPFARGNNGTLYLLGTDALGRDVWSRLLYGGRISLMVGVSAVLISGTIGVALGLVSGYLGGRVDTVLTRMAEIQLAFPPILLMIAILGVVGQGLQNVIIVLGISGWVMYARVVRGVVLSLRSREFVQAAESLGASTIRIIARHIIPNSLSPLIVISTFAVSANIISEASLSFLGLGVRLETPTWGGMLSESRSYLESAWWWATFPGLALALTVVSVNVSGDWLRDYLDPRLKIAGATQ